MNQFAIEAVLPKHSQKMLAIANQGSIVAVITIIPGILTNQFIM